MKQASVSQYEASVTIPPLAGFTAVEDVKPESRVQVEYVPVYNITDLA